MSTTVTPEVRARRLAWIEALESGEYPQSRKALRTNDGYCCIGLCARAVLGVDNDALLGEADPVTGTWTDAWEQNHLYSAVSDELGFSLTIQDHLISMNDSRRRSFPFIARFLRKVWGLTDA